MTRMGALSSAMARMAQMTAAPPAMSSFMRSMPSAGLIEMPPVSKVMPLPTSPSTGDAGAPGGLWRMTITRGGSALPRATPSSSPIPSCAISRLVEHLHARRPRSCRSPRRARRRPTASARSTARWQSSRARLQRLAEDPSALDGAPRGPTGRPPGRLRGSGSRPARVRPALAALVTIAAEGREHQPFRSGLDRLGKRDVAAVEPREALHAALSSLQAPRPWRRAATARS